MNEHRDASNRLTFDFDKIESGMYSKITNVVVAQFGLEAESTITKGLDEVFQNFRLHDEIIGLEWDNWSGYIVNAQSENAEPLAIKVGTYINENFNS